MIDLTYAAFGALIFIAGAVGAGAQPGDRVRDFPRVFMRKPKVFLTGAVTFAIATVVFRALRG